MTRPRSIPPSSHSKRYDRAYFDRWYRNPRYRIGSSADLGRKVRLALAMAEYVLARPIRSVLDLGCGEGRWQPILRRLRPKVRYTGVDSSAYAVRRFGRRRNIRRGRLSDLSSLGLRGPFDLVVCSDVLHYVTDEELVIGLDALVPLMGGIAYLEVFTAADEIEGDRARFANRTAAMYHRVFERAGLVPCGMHCYVARELARDLVALELPPPPSRSSSGPSSRGR